MKFHLIKENLLKGADIKNSSFFAHVKSLNRHNQRPPGGYGFGVSEENDGSMSIWKFVRSLCCIDRSRIHETTEDEDSDNIEMRPISVDSVPISPVHGIEKAQSDLYAEKYKYNPLICPIEEDADGNVSIQDILDTIHDRASKISTISTSKDTHYSPLLPDSYCQFRIGNLLKYYRKHIPRANRLRHFCQILSVGGSISGVFLATYNLQQWAAVTAILVSSASAWLEFTGANEKIARFSSQVHKLTELKHWWETRKSIEKSNINNIDRLVFEVEQLVMSSLSAWSSESNAAKTMSKLAEDKNSDGDGKEGEERSSDLNV